MREPARRAPTLEDTARVFGALSHETRRHIVQLLAHFGPELPSGYFASRFASSWPTTTRHLHVLEGAGVVSVRREGRNWMYRLERKRVSDVVGGWLELLQPGSSTERWTPSGPRPSKKGVPR